MKCDNLEGLGPQVCTHPRESQFIADVMKITSEVKWLMVFSGFSCSSISATCFSPHQTLEEIYLTTKKLIMGPESFEKCFRHSYTQGGSKPVPPSSSRPCAILCPVPSSSRFAFLLRQTKKMSQYGRSTSNYGTCKKCLMHYMIIMHMSPYDTYGSM